MKKFTRNSFDDVVVKCDSHIIDVFSSVSGKKKILVQTKAHFVYLVVAKSSHVDLYIDIETQDAVCRIFAIFVSDKDPVKANLITHISGSGVKVEKYVLSLLWNDGKISADAAIDIVPGIADVSAHLLEENIVFGQHISVKSLPALSVASHNVQASHGAKIEKINPEKLFYVSSKWLSQEESQTLVVDWYVNAILSHFDHYSEEELSELKQFVQICHS